MSRVFIVTEGGKGLGFGHITRCVSLYQAFKEKGIGAEFIVNGDKTIKTLLTGKKYQIFNWLKERNRFVNLIDKADIVIVDSYLAGPRSYEAVSKLARIPVYIDDNKRLRYQRGFVINANVYAEELSYPRSKDITYLLGSRYALLRKEFWEIPEKKTQNNIGSIMITFGGYDGKNMTSKVLKAMDGEYHSLKKNVIAAEGFRRTAKAGNFKSGKTNIIYSPDPKKLKEIMLQSDIAISAGGQTLYELARLGVPTIGICVALNQEQNLKRWKDLGFIEYIGWYHDKGLLSKLAKSMSVFSCYATRAKCAKIGRNLIDGKGARRIARALLKG